MTNEDKFKAIVDRIKAEGWCTEPTFISVMVIINYLDQLQKTKVIECAFSMTETGKNIVAICDEFDWKPSDEDIIRFVTEMVDEPDKTAFAYLIKRYRDDKEKLLKEIEDDLNK